MVLEDPADFGEPFSVENSEVLFSFGPHLAAAAEDCLEGAGQALAGFVLDLVEAPVSETGFVTFFLGVSLAVLCATEDLDPSLLSSLLGEAGFFVDDPCLDTNSKTENRTER